MYNCIHYFYNIITLINYFKITLKSSLYLEIHKKTNKNFHNEFIYDCIYIVFFNY